MFEIDYYELPNGNKPVMQYIDSLDYSMRAKALGYIEILSKFGNKLRGPYSKSMGKGLYELRIRFAGDIARIFYFFIVNNKIILTSGFTKKTQKTPSSEVAIARKYKDDYEKRILRNE